jgi:predicted nucleic acid-binding protein
MARWYFDTSVIVAASIPGHVHNAAASDVMEEMKRAGHQAYMSTHSLTEV